MRGSIKDFEFGVDLLFDIGKRSGRNVLDLALLVRRSSELASKQPESQFLRPPPGATSGGGGAVGPFTLQFWLPQRELWVNGVRLLTLAPGNNVVLLDEQAGSLVEAGTAEVSMDFESVAVPLRSNDPSPLDVWAVLLRQAFSRSDSVASFIASSAHPAFKPLPDFKTVRGSHFAPGIDSWCCIQVVNQHPRLRCAVLVHLLDASRVTAEPVWRGAPAFAGPACGASFGPYAVIYDIERDALWIDGVVQPSSEGKNVYLLRERGAALELVGTLAVEADLRASPRWRDAVLSSPAFSALKDAAIL